MAVKDLSSLFAIGVDILNAVRDAVTNVTLFQTGDVVTGQVESDRVESWQHGGFCSMPSNPVDGKSACQGVVIKRGDLDVCVATRDARGLELAGNLGAGDTTVYAAGPDGTGQARIMLKGSTGTVSLMTTDTNTKSGTACVFEISPTQLAFDAPWGSLVFNNTGLHIKTGGAFGPRFDMGQTVFPGVPASLTAALTSYVRFTASKFSAKAAIVLLGPGPAYNTVVMAPSSAITTPVPVMTGPQSQAAAVRVSTT